MKRKKQRNTVMEKFQNLSRLTILIVKKVSKFKQEESVFYDFRTPNGANWGS